MYRYAVIGGGGIGSAAAYWLSRRAGEEVPCLEQWELGHGQGASEDHSRIIRLGYHSAAYTALTPSAYAAWREVEAESGVELQSVDARSRYSVLPMDRLEADLRFLREKYPRLTAGFHDPNFAIRFDASLRFEKADFIL